MGHLQCKPTNKKIISNIHKRLSIQTESIDQKLHFEYLRLKGQFKEKLDDFQKTNHNQKSISRFKKWYEMSFPDLFNYPQKNQMQLKRNHTENPIKSLITSISPKKIKLKDPCEFSELSLFSLEKSKIDSKSSFHFRENSPEITLTNTSVEIGLRMFKSNNYELFKSRLSKGPPEVFRWTAWVVFADLPQDRDKTTYHNFMIEDLEHSIQTQIKKDLHRTLNINDIDNMNSLYNILKAFANSHKQLGYCQGMNFIAGYLLILSNNNEVDTFYMMVSLFNFSFRENIGISGFYTNEFPLLKLFVFIFNSLFIENFPELKEHFIEMGIPNDFWVTKWFQSLFTIVLPINMLVRLWDSIFCYGLIFIIDFTLTLLRFLESYLLKTQAIEEIDELFKFMNSENQENNIFEMKFDIEELLIYTKKNRTNPKKLKFLEIEFQNIFHIEVEDLKIKIDDIELNNDYDEISLPTQQKKVETIINKSSSQGESNDTIINSEIKTEFYINDSLSNLNDSSTNNKMNIPYEIKAVAKNPFDKFRIEKRKNKNLILNVSSKPPESPKRKLNY